MKFKKKDILIVLITFIFSMILSSFAIIEIERKYSSEFKNAMDKAGISKIEAALDIYGKNIPEKKVKIYNSIIDEKYKIDYSKKDMYSRFKDIEIVIVIAIILTAIIDTPYFSFMSRLRLKRKRKEELFMKNEYINKYSLSDKKFYVKCLESVNYNSQIKNKELVTWLEGGFINFVNRDYKNDIGLIKINLDAIMCFSRFGDFYTSLNISGGDSSYGKAALGYLIAGAAGAIVASRNALSSYTEVHDKRETILFINDGDEEKYIFFEPNFYDFLMHSIPGKEINHKLKNETNVSGNSKVEELRQLGELREKGVINQEEFEKLKINLID